MRGFGFLYKGEFLLMFLFMKIEFLKISVRFNFNVVWVILNFLVV